jgi:threonine dehydrogenase-like Zn-dependent dehydrogenase
MWAYTVTAPGRLERVEVPVPEAGPGRVLVRLGAGGICGSDLPSFLGRRNPFVDSLGQPGYPLHEVVGVTEAGTRIVGWAEHHKGLAEYFVAREDAIVELDGELSDVEATVVQPLCTVLHQLDRVEVAGKRVAVIGQGPIGLLFSHAAKTRGAAHVTGVDRVDRSDCASTFGVDEVVWEDAMAWAQEAEADIVVEAVGHHAGPLEAAVEALAEHGTVVAFGVPDETHYAFPFTAFFRKHATLIAGAATERARALAAARDYLREHRSLLGPYITDVLAIEQAQDAFERAVDPVVGRLKVVLEVR